MGSGQSSDNSNNESSTDTNSSDNSMSHTSLENKSYTNSDISIKEDSIEYTTSEETSDTDCQHIRNEFINYTKNLDGLVQRKNYLVSKYYSMKNEIVSELDGIDEKITTIQDELSDPDFKNTIDNYLTCLNKEQKKLERRSRRDRGRGCRSYELD